MFRFSSLWVEFHLHPSWMPGFQQYVIIPLLIKLRLCCFFLKLEHIGSEKHTAVAVLSFVVFCIGLAQMIFWTMAVYNRLEIKPAQYCRKKNMCRGLHKYHIGYSSWVVRIMPQRKPVNVHFFDSEKYSLVNFYQVGNDLAPLLVPTITIPKVHSITANLEIFLLFQEKMHVTRS